MGPATPARSPPDGTFDQGRGDPTVGTEALTAFADGFPAMIKGRHWINNLLIEPSETGASGKCYLILFRLGEDGAAPMVTAVYNDELTKGPDGWRFASRKVVGDA